MAAKCPYNGRFSISSVILNNNEAAVPDMALSVSTQLTKFIHEKDPDREYKSRAQRKCQKVRSMTKREGSKSAKGRSR